jgi:uncharacterized protein YyaL (SSP411 family)
VKLPIRLAWIVLLAWTTVAGASAAVTRQQLVTWGTEVYQDTVLSLKVPGSSLFAESATATSRFGGNGGFAYVWPLSAQFRVLDSLTRLDPVTYTPILRQFSDELRTRYWTSGTVGGLSGGYRSGVGSSATRFFDDNAHLAVALAEAYHITGEAVYLTRAIETYNFVLKGENTVGGGGTYFSESDHSFKDSAGTLQGTRAALTLYQETGTSQYLSAAF